MPELPEVEFARGCLARWLRGKKLARVEADPGRVIRGTPRSAFAGLGGHCVRLVERRGKWLLLEFDGDTGLLAHLGMTGKFELATPGTPVRWSRVRFVRPDGKVVHYRDPRQFGRLTIGPLAALLTSAPLADLGPDAYAPPLTAKKLVAQIEGRRRPIKDLLMDQTVIAGLGNIQATEALFLARLHPLKRSETLTSADLARFARAIRASLVRTLRMNKGDKITYVEETKRVENPFLVYGKAGLPCPRCGTTLQKTVLSGRTTVFCPRCQKK